MTKLGQMIAICALMLLGGCASWSGETKGFVIANEVLTVMDTMQTRAALSYPCYTENNPILGQRPSSKSIVLFGVIKTGLYMAGTAWLESNDASLESRRVWHGLWLASNIFYVGNNWIQGGKLFGASSC